MIVTPEKFKDHAVISLDFYHELVEAKAALLDIENNNGVVTIERSGYYRGVTTVASKDEVFLELKSKIHRLNRDNSLLNMELKELKRNWLIKLIIKLEGYGTNRSRTNRNDVRGTL